MELSSTPRPSWAVLGTRVPSTVTVVRSGLSPRMKMYPVSPRSGRAETPGMRRRASGTVASGKRSICSEETTVRMDAAVRCRFSASACPVCPSTRIP
jgi:hypothetical protein